MESEYLKSPLDDIDEENAEKSVIHPELEDYLAGPEARKQIVVFATKVNTAKLNSDNSILSEEYLHRRYEAVDLDLAALRESLEKLQQDNPEIRLNTLYASNSLVIDAPSETIQSLIDPLALRVDVSRIIPNFSWRIDEGEEDEFDFETG